MGTRLTPLLSSIYCKFTIYDYTTPGTVTYIQGLTTEMVSFFQKDMLAMVCSQVVDNTVSEDHHYGSYDGDLDHGVT